MVDGHGNWLALKRMTAQGERLEAVNQKLFRKSLNQ